MNEPVTDSYRINTEDKQMHAIEVILTVLDRHVAANPKDPSCDEYVLDCHNDMIRCVEYVLSRLKSNSHLNTGE